MTTLTLAPSASHDGPCASCKALYGKSCCELRGSEEGADLIPMSFAEARRLARHVKLPLAEAVKIERKVGGLVFKLPLVGDRCRYLGKHGCTVPDVKPNYCSLYPFKKNAKGEWVAVPTEHGVCFGADVAQRDGAKMLAVFHTTAGKLNRIAQRMKRDWSAHYSAVAKYQAESET